MWRWLGVFPAGWVQLFAELSGAGHQPFVRVPEVLFVRKLFNIFHVTVHGV